MGCRACVKDPVARALFGSNALCPDCDSRWRRIRPPRAQHKSDAWLYVLAWLSAWCLAGLLLLAAGYTQAKKQAGWDTCASKAQGEIAEPQDYDRVVQNCGIRPNFF